MDNHKCKIGKAVGNRIKFCKGWGSVNSFLFFFSSSRQKEKEVGNFATFVSQVKLQLV